MCIGKIVILFGGEDVHCCLQPFISDLGFQTSKTEHKADSVGAETARIHFLKGKYNIFPDALPWAPEDTTNHQLVLSTDGWPQLCLNSLPVQKTPVHMLIPFPWSTAVNNYHKLHLIFVFYVIFLIYVDMFVSGFHIFSFSSTNGEAPVIYYQ